MLKVTCINQPAILSYLSYLRTNCFMKNFFFLLFLFPVVKSKAQNNILIPFRKGNLYGLCNEQKKIIIEPTYDNIKWEGGQWFETSRQVAVTDSILYGDGKYHKLTEKITLTGLIHRDKIILKDLPYNGYEIVAGKCIIGKTENRLLNRGYESNSRGRRKDKVYSLFSLKGKNVYLENFSRLEKGDTTGTSSKNKNEARFILFAAEHIDNRKSIFVFDADKQVISEWLVKNAVNIKLEEISRERKNVLFEFTDSAYQEKTAQIDYNKGKFVLYAVKNKEKPIKKYGSGNMGTVSEETLVTDAPMAIPMDRDMQTVKYDPPPFKPYTSLKKDSLFYHPEENKKVLMPIDSTMKLIFQEDKQKIFYRPVVYKKEGKFGMIFKGEVMKPDFDSLVYFGNRFIAYKLNGNKISCGILDENGIVAIPFIYDSIKADIPLLDVDFSKDNDHRFIIKEANERNRYIKSNPYVRQASELTTVYKDGLAGITDSKGEIIIPMAYTLIARNNLNFMRPNISEYIILNRNNLYGYTKIDYNSKLKKYEAPNIATPVFPYIPCYYYQHYYSVKEFKLFGLYDEHFKLKGYASENGTTYFE